MFYCLLRVYITEVSRRGIMFIFALYLRVQCEVFHRDYDLAVTYSHLFSFRLAFNSLKKHEYCFLYFIVIIIIIYNIYIAHYLIMITLSS
jgi:hypothetical protein